MGLKYTLNPTLLVTLATRLQGWRWTVNNKLGYLKETGHMFRRALLASRGLESSPDVLKHVRTVLNVSVY